MQILMLVADLYSSEIASYLAKDVLGYRNLFNWNPSTLYH